MDYITLKEARDDLGSYIRTVYHMVSHTPKGKAAGSTPVWDILQNREGLFF